MQQQVIPSMNHFQNMPNTMMNPAQQVLPSPFGSQMNIGQPSQLMPSHPMLSPMNGVQNPMNPMIPLNNQRFNETVYDDLSNRLHVEGSYVRTKSVPNNNRVHIFNIGNSIYIATQRNNNNRQNYNSNNNYGNQNRQNNGNQYRQNNGYNNNRNNNGQQQYRNNNGNSNNNNGQRVRSVSVKPAPFNYGLVDLFRYTKNSYSLYLNDYYGRDILVYNSNDNSQPQMMTSSSSYLQPTNII